MRNPHVKSFKPDPLQMLHPSFNQVTLTSDEKTERDVLRHSREILNKHRITNNYTEGAPSVSSLPKVLIVTKGNKGQRKVVPNC